MVICSIDKDGSLGFEDGRHRLYASAVLGLKQIPVMVSARHYEWVTKKLSYLSALYSGTELKDFEHRFLNHPDIKHLNSSCWIRPFSKNNNI